MDTLACINNTIWEAYANKTISQADFIYMTNHVKTCQICADVKEGIDALAMPELLVNRVDKVNKAVDEIIEQKCKKKSLIYYWGAAAILLLSVGLFWYNTLDFKEEIALKDTFKTVPKNEAQKLENDSIYKRIPPPAFENKTDKKLAQKFDKGVTVQDEIPSVQLESEVIMDMAKNAEVNETPTEMKAVIEPKTDMIYTVQKNEYAKMERAEEKPVSAYKDIRTQKQGKISLPAAMSNNVLNNNIDYVSNSIALIPLPDSTSYNLALLAFNANKFDSCTMYLTAIIANKTTVFYEQALNLLAKTYLKQHKKAAAKKVLNDLKYFKINKQKAAE